MMYLINPSEHKILENAGDRIPYGLLNIATATTNTKIYDLNHDFEEGLMHNIKREKPSMVGISVYTSPVYNEAVRLAERLKGKTHLIAGGYHASAMPETLKIFDTVIEGPALEFGKTRNVDFSLINLNNYGIDYDGKKYGTLITSVGCPFNCAFCFNMSKEVQYKDIDFIKKEIDDLSKHFEGIYFLDDVFTLNKERMEDIISYTWEKGLESRITTRANLLDSSKIKILAENGCEWLSIGIESGDDEILKRSNKKMTIEDNCKAVEMSSRYGIKSKGFFIIGLPGETEKTARDTIDFSLELYSQGLEKADFYFLTPYPGTPIWKNPERFGINIRDRDYTKYLQAGKGARCVIDTEELKAERIEELVKEAKDLWKNSI